MWSRIGNGTLDASTSLIVVSFGCWFHLEFDWHSLVSLAIPGAHNDVRSGRESGVLGIGPQLKTT